jgi:hypothetical protein
MQVGDFFVVQNPSQKRRWNLHRAISGWCERRAEKWPEKAPLVFTVRRPVNVPDMYICRRVK